MDEINPYAAPGSALYIETAHAFGKPLGYGLYKWINWAYGALAVLVFVLFFIQKAPVLSLALTTGVMVFAPLISYLLVAARWRWVFYGWLLVHLVCVCVMAAITAEWSEAKSASRVTVAMFLSVFNMLSWLSSLYFHWRLGKK